MAVDKQDELERTFLVRYLPPGLTDVRSKEIHDIYIPHDAPHCRLRLRKSGEAYEMTKKEPALQGDSSHMVEYTIPLSITEFKALRTIKGKEVRKVRYYYSADNVIYEVGIFQDALSGLVAVDVEFADKESMSSFQLPEWFLVEVTREDFLAGGELCGKSYADLAPRLEKLGYKPLIF